MARRRLTKAERQLADFLLVGAMAVAVMVLGALVSFVSNVDEYIGENKIFFIIAASVLFVVSVIAAVRWIRQTSRRKAELQASIAKVRIPDNRADYIISNADYRRGTPRENFYRKAFLLSLLSLFDNRCAKCGTRENGVDIDHFVLSKNEGGSFAMFHRDGFWVNNAIPLCQTCNRSKLDRSYRLFFAEEQLLGILQRNAEMTKRLNANPSMAQFRPGRAAQQAPEVRPPDHGPWPQQSGPVLDAMAKSAARAVGSQLGRQIIRGVLGSLFGGRRR